MGCACYSYVRYHLRDWIYRQCDHLYRYMEESDYADSDELLLVQFSGIRLATFDIR